MCTRSLRGEKGKGGGGGGRKKRRGETHTENQRERERERDWIYWSSLSEHWTLLTKVIFVRCFVCLFCFVFVASSTIDLKMKVCLAKY